MFWPGVDVKKNIYTFLIWTQILKQLLLFFIFWGGIFHYFLFMLNADVILVLKCKPTNNHWCSCIGPDQQMYTASQYEFRGSPDVRRNFPSPTVRTEEAPTRWLDGEYPGVGSNPLKGPIPMSPPSLPPGSLAFMVLFKDLFKCLFWCSSHQVFKEDWSSTFCSACYLKG